jgi:hypothetical protein
LKKKAQASSNERSEPVSKPKKRSNPSISKQSAKAQSSESGGVEHFSEEPKETGSVDKIRDIIFGNQMRDYERRFVGLEEHLLKEIAGLREETIKRLDALESYIKKELVSLSEKIKTEQDTRAESVGKVSQELKDTTSAISKKIERQAEKQSTDSRDLRQQLLDQSKNLSNEIGHKYRESSAETNRLIQELREQKVDRSAFSELLMEIAVRMSNELAEKLNLEVGDSRNG